MGLPIFYVEGGREPGDTVRLGPEDSVHAVRSLRIRTGDRFTVSDGAGWVGEVRLLGDDPDGAAAEILSVRRLLAPVPAVTVMFVPPSGDRTWWAVQKLTEIGVDRIALAASERGLRRGTGPEALHRRASAVAHESAKQSRRAFLPETQVGGDLTGPGAAGSTVILLWEGATVPIADRWPAAVPSGLEVRVGPEGGLSDAEVARAEASGAVLASLGEANLRTETAALVAGVLALARFGRFSSPRLMTT